VKNFLLITTLLFLTAFYPIDKIGGNIAGSPEEMETHLSSGAKALIEKAFADVKPGDLVDHHVHIVGLDKSQGTEVNSRMLSWWRIIDYIKTSVYLSGSGVGDKDNANEQYVERLLNLIKVGNRHGKYHILAFDHNYNEDGAVNYNKSEFYTSNEYVMKLAKQYPDIFVPVISVHPYRKDAIEELTKYAKQGVRWIKWLPNAHNIDASSPRLDEYYRAMKKYNMVLLTHTGEEQAVHAKDDQKLGNPLLFRKPLDMGVKVVMAHCASLGEDEDLDNPGHKVPSFDLFMRLMDNSKYDGLLYGEISAMTQFNRLPKPLLTLLERTDLHHRLVNGSDYPLPAINIVIQTRSLVNYGMITKEERKYLNEIYKYNPLLFDYVLKRTIKHPQFGTTFNKIVFGEIR
jgi:predicted TIM-barrel fold metal-dependent hydrolase